MTEEQAIEYVNTVIAGLEYQKKYNVKGYSSEIHKFLIIINRLAKKEYSRKLTVTIIKEKKS